MEEIILDLVAEIFGSIFYESVVKGERESFSFDKDGNLLGGPKTDAPYDKKQAYKQLKALKRDGVISKKEYDKLYEFQKQQDEINDRIKSLLSTENLSIENAIQCLNTCEEEIDLLYHNNKMDSEKYNRIKNTIHVKRVKLISMEEK